MIQFIIANRTDGKCALSDRCLKMMTQPEAKYYVATHQVLFSIQAQLVSVISKKIAKYIRRILETPKFRTKRSINSDVLHRHRFSELGLRGGNTDWLVSKSFPLSLSD